VAHRIVAVASPDPLDAAPILRLLLAIGLASGGAHDDWLTANKGRFDLFAPEAPFAQMGVLRDHAGEERIWSPAATLPYRTAGNGAVLLDHDHNESGTRLTPAEA